MREPIQPIVGPRDRCRNRALRILLLHLRDAVPCIIGVVRRRAVVKRRFRSPVQRVIRVTGRQNSQVERFIGTVKRVLAMEPLADGPALSDALREIRSWYNHERPHDHLQGRTLAEVWAGMTCLACDIGHGHWFIERACCRSRGSKRHLY